MSHSYFEIGGKVMQLATPQQQMQGSLSLTSPGKHLKHLNRAKKAGRLVKQATKRIHPYQEIDEEGYWETIGEAVGTGFGIGISIATIPVTMLDGPLLYFDYAWAIGSLGLIKKLGDLGGEIGSKFD